MKEDRHSKHNKKRKIVGISLYSKDQALMREKYGRILTGTQIKDIVLKGEFIERTVVTNKTPLNSEVHNQLKKVGNNLNQLAHIANAKKDTPQEAVLLRELRELRQVTKLIRDLL